MEYVPSKKFSHVDNLSKLIPKYCELLADTAFVALKNESEIKEVLVNTICKLTVRKK